jgi:hypothetical protein
MVSSPIEHADVRLGSVRQRIRQAVPSVSEGPIDGDPGELCNFFAPRKWGGRTEPPLLILATGTGRTGGAGFAFRSRALGLPRHSCGSWIIEDSYYAPSI